MRYISLSLLRYLQCLFIVFVISSCSRNHEHALIKNKELGIYQFSSQLIPTEIVVEKEAEGKNLSVKQLDSLSKDIEKTVRFMVTIKLKGTDTNNDVLFSGLTDYGEYKSRIHNLNFNAVEFFKLKIGNEEFLPVLSNLENTYGLKNEVKLHLIFMPGKKMVADYDLVFDDQVFNTGISHFYYSKNSK